MVDLRKRKVRLSLEICRMSQLQARSMKQTLPWKAGRLLQRRQNLQSNTMHDSSCSQSGSQTYLLISTLIGAPADSAILANISIAIWLAMTSAHALPRL